MANTLCQCLAIFNFFLLIHFEYSTGKSVSTEHRHKLFGTEQIFAAFHSWTSFFYYLQDFFLLFTLEQGYCRFELLFQRKFHLNEKPLENQFEVTI